MSERSDRSVDGLLAAARRERPRGGAHGRAVEGVLAALTAEGTRPVARRRNTTKAVWAAASLGVLALVLGSLRARGPGMPAASPRTAVSPAASVDDQLAPAATPPVMHAQAAPGPELQTSVAIPPVEPHPRRDAGAAAAKAAAAAAKAATAVRAGGTTPRTPCTCAPKDALCSCL